MRQFVTTGIVLNRTDYGEADRILTMLTPDQGKLRLMAKGVRRVKSKLAGGIELFSISHVTYIQNRKDSGGIHTLISARLIKHHGGIVKDIQRTMLGYDLIKRLDKATEDEPEDEYFELLRQAFEVLEDTGIGLELVRLWFLMRLLRLSGHMPNLQTDAHGDRLEINSRYSFSFDDMAFAASAQGPFRANHIKFLRLGFAGHSPRALGQVKDGQTLTVELLPLVQTMLQVHVRS